MQQREASAISRRKTAGYGATADKPTEELCPILLLASIAGATHRRPMNTATVRTTLTHHGAFSSTSDTFSSRRGISEFIQIFGFWLAAALALASMTCLARSFAGTMSFMPVS